jgi:mitochondrial translocator assembly and maintenance protein 41
MIAGISYMGDFRMSFGENPNKVANIVENQFLNFRRLYSPLMDSLPNLDLLTSNESKLRLGKDDVSVACLQQDMSPIRRGNMVIRLPREFREKLYARYSHKFNDMEQLRIVGQGSGSGIQEDTRRCSEFDKRIAGDQDLPKEISRAIRHTVGWPSITQSAKGILTAGLARGFRYSSEKLKKYYFGKSQKS